MTAAKPPARQRDQGALANGFATAELHHLRGHDLGGLIKAAWLRRFAVAPARQSGDLVTQSWDTASKSGELNDYSVCETWLRRAQDHYLLDVFRARLDWPCVAPWSG